MLDFARFFGRRSRFMFWGIVPIGVALLALMTLTFTEWTVKRAIMIGVMDLTFLLFAIGIYDPLRFTWAMRAAMAVVGLGYVSYFLDAFFFTKSQRFDAFHGLLAIGIPALLFAVRGFAVKLKKSIRRDPYAPPPPIHPK